MDAAAATVYRGQHECGRFPLPPSIRAIGRHRGSCLHGGTIFSLFLPGRPPLRLVRGTRVTRRKLMRGSYSSSPRTSTKGHPRPDRLLRTCFENFLSFPSSLQNFCKECSGWNLSLSCLLRYTNTTRACTRRALKVSALVQLG